MPVCASIVNPPKKERRPDAKDVKQLIGPLAIILIIVIADQATKLWAVANLSPPEPALKVLGDFLMFDLVTNPGGAMGTRLGPSGFYLAMALIVLPLVLYYIYRNRSLIAVSIPLSLIAGGAIGNLIDRIRLGEVIDFIDVDIPDIDFLGFELTRWWTFNIADAAISCAILFLVIHMFINRKSLDPDDSSEKKMASTSPSEG